MVRWRVTLLLLTVLEGLLLSGCGNGLQEGNAGKNDGNTAVQNVPEAVSPDVQAAQETEKDSEMAIQIGDTTLRAVLEENSSADGLRELLKDGPVTIAVENYGGFEKVGSLPESLPREDVQMTAQPGDIVLYQGNSIVFFYGSNSWSYAKLGEIRDVDRGELEEILGGAETELTLSLTEK